MGLGLSPPSDASRTRYPPRPPPPRQSRLPPRRSPSPALCPSWTASGGRSYKPPATAPPRPRFYGSITFARSAPAATSVSLASLINPCTCQERNAQHVTDNTQTLGAVSQHARGLDKRSSLARTDPRRPSVRSRHRRGPKQIRLVHITEEVRLSRPGRILGSPFSQHQCSVVRVRLCTRTGAGNGFCGSHREL